MATLKSRILFMCVANSARSQLAEAIAKKSFGDKALIESAGSEPKNVNPLARQVLEEIGIDTSKAFSKSVSQLSPDFIDSVDYVITLCAEEVCPILNSTSAKRIHWPLPDPAAVSGTESEMLTAFREIREVLKEKIVTFGNKIKI